MRIWALKLLIALCNLGLREFGNIPKARYEITKLKNDTYRRLYGSR